ncbi:MAG TPA: recombinase family protein [Polyangiaceae bacterium]
MRAAIAGSAGSVRAVIYARRSQQHQDASVETQVEEARRFVLKKGWTLVAEYRDDDKNTGRKEFQKRKEFLRLLADANENKFDVVVVRDNTRLGGDTSRTMRAIEDLKDEGVAVWYYITGTEVRLETWIDKATFAIQNAASEGERDGISSRTFEALMVRARAGFNAGGACYGYDNVPILEGSVKKRTEYKLNESQAAVVREVFQMYAEGEGLRAIAKALNGRGVPSPWAGKRGTGSWSLGVIRPMLLRERYRGVIVYGRMKKTYKRGTKVRIRRPDDELVRVEAPHLRIVPEDLWNTVQERFQDNARKPWKLTRGRKPRYMLSRLGRCAECGGPIHAKNGKQGQTPIKVYLCGYYQDRAACKNSLRRPVDDIDAKCVGWIKERLLQEDVILAVLAEVRRRVVEQSKETGPEIDQLEAQATALRREVSNLAEAIALTKGSVTALSEKLSERQDRLVTIEARLKLLNAAPDVLSLEVRRLEAGVRKRIAELREFLDRDVDEARKVIEAVLDGPLTFTPTKTPEGRRYEVTGRIATGDVLRVLSNPQKERPQRESNPR